MQSGEFGPFFHTKTAEPFYAICCVAFSQTVIPQMILMLLLFTCQVHCDDGFEKRTGFHFGVIP